MGKECTKSACHKSSKVPTSESANATCKKKKEVVTCGECKRAGHSGRKCPMPKRSKKSKADMLNRDMDKVSLLDQFSKKQRRCKMNVELLDW
mmetsp:Transcript_4578/g.8161  ORF Transcript_4578/g.8161 Transcript_4578/m.8161 type:complete len:92 (-) Transcript_4578:62-337(-)